MFSNVSSLNLRFFFATTLAPVNARVIGLSAQVVALFTWLQPDLDWSMDKLALEGAMLVPTVEGDPEEAWS